MKRTIIITLVTAGSLLLSACNTIQGIGQDIKDGGSYMDKTINGDRGQDR
jgi:predicted small secreted protein